MASDISNIIKSEISNTLESLLSASSNVEEVVLVGNEDLDDTQCVNTAVTFDFSGKSANWNYFIPAASATQFEYLMLGGVTDLKDTIDDEITDAVKEIISTISGSICTSVNAQGFADISGIKSTLGDSSVVALSTNSEKNKIYKFIIKLNDDNLELYISFDEASIAFVEALTDDKAVSTDESNIGEQPTSIISREKCQLKHVTNRFRLLKDKEIFSPLLYESDAKRKLIANNIILPFIASSYIFLKFSIKIKTKYNVQKCANLMIV